MPKFTKSLLLIASLFVYCTSFANTQWVSLNPITPHSLNQFINKTGLFKATHSPSMKKTILTSIGVDSGQYYSTYVMQPLKFYKKVTLYKTTETIQNGSRFPGIPKGSEAVVHGKGLSLGGIFWPKEQMLVYNANGKTIYDNRINIIAIKPISGHLFPMKVGNQLKFAFKRIHSRLIGGRTTVKKENGVMTYKVINEFDGFAYSKKPVPGKVFEIEVWETTNLHPKPYLTDIYEYSNTFHWYVSDKYFTRSNKLIAWYRVRNWV